MQENCKYLDGSVLEVSWIASQELAMTVGGSLYLHIRHCERSEAIQEHPRKRLFRDTIWGITENYTRRELVS